MPKPLMPQGGNGARGKGVMLGKPKGIEITVAVTSEHHCPGMKILDGKANSEGIEKMNFGRHLPNPFAAASASMAPSSSHSTSSSYDDSTLVTFGVESHVQSPTPSEEHTDEWRKVDPCIVNWIFTTVTKVVFDTVC